MSMRGKLFVWSKNHLNLIAPSHLSASHCSHCNCIDWTHEITQETTARASIIHLHQQLKKKTHSFPSHCHEGKWKSTRQRPLWIQSWPGHLLVRFLSHGKYVRVHVPHVLPAVGIDDLLAIDLELLVRVDGHKHNSCTQNRSAHGSHSPVDVSFLLTDRLKTCCSNRVWAKYIFFNEGLCNGQKINWMTQ